MKRDELKKHNPSKYTVYQMLRYCKNIKLIKKFSDNTYLIKTKPFIDELYNYAYVFKSNLNKKDIKKIKEFFGKDKYNIETNANKKLKKFLVSEDFSFKYPGNSMVNKKIKQGFKIKLPRGIKIIQVHNKKTFNDFKKIFAEAFDCTMKDAENKLGFMSQIIKNKKDNHINLFILYKNNIPASTGSYYAFDEFSIENIGTKIKFRKKGYAHIIMQVLMNEAKKLGYSKACLVGSDEGAKVYKSFGLKTINKTNTFTTKNLS